MSEKQIKKCSISGDTACSAEYGAESNEFEQRVHLAMREIHGLLAMDGGGIDLLEVDFPGRSVKVKLTGACSGCPSAVVTLKHGVEQLLRERVPEIRTIKSL